MKKHLSKMWGAIAEPRRITAAMIVAYLLFMAQGIFNSIHPLVDDLTVDFVRVGINLMLIAGGAVGAVACSRGYWLFEKPAMMMVATAYSVHLIWVVFDLDANGIIEHGKLVRILIALIFLYTRYERIRGSLVDPRKG